MPVSFVSSEVMREIKLSEKSCSYKDSLSKGLQRRQRLHAEQSPSVSLGYITLEGVSVFL